MTRAPTVALAAALLFASQRASAAGVCGGPDHPGIVLRAEGLAPALRTRIAAQLRTALASRGFDLCEPDAADGAVAELDVTSLAPREPAIESSPPSSAAAASAAVALTLSVNDQVTDKRVSRDLDLRGIPEDGRALVIAQAADELLRASWAELLVADAPKPKREVPPQITNAVPPPDVAPPPVAPSPRAPVLEVGASFALEHFARGSFTQLGPELSVGAFPFSRLGAVARVGVRSGNRAEAAAGTVDPSSIVVGVGIVGAALPRTGRFGLEAGPELLVTRVHYTVEAAPGAAAHDGNATASYLSAIAHAWMVVAPPVRVTLGVALGAPLHTVRALADGTTVASIGGALFGGELGLGATW